jgi:hypothetical protein
MYQKSHLLRLALAATLLTSATSLVSAAAPVHVSPADISWRKFLAQHDMYWNSIGTDYYGGAILGNGLLGLNIYEETAKQYRFNVGRTDVTEGRNMLPGYESNSHLFTAARLPIGYFRLTTKGAVTGTGEKIRLSIYDAIATGTLTTASGTIDFKTYIHATKNYIVLQTEATEGEQDFGWTFVPQTAISPRVLNNGSGERAYYNAHPNPAVKPLATDGDYHLSVQNLECGKTYVVAWKEVSEGAKRHIIATVSQEGTSGDPVGASEAIAIASAKKDIDEGFADLSSATAEASHTAWWNAYYPQSFATFGNTKMETFYWLQLYKFACASRPDKPLVDIQGPWPVANTPWPCVWMNLNTQLTYSWQYKANQSAMSEPLWKAFVDYDANLTRNVTDIPNQQDWTDAVAMSRSTTYNLYRPLEPTLASVNQYETGNMTWLLFYYWQYCTYNHREDILIDHFFSLLKRAINLYFHLRTTGTDGLYHLPVTASPEYSSSYGFEDCSYDLASLRWGLQTLIGINSKYSLGDPKAADWQDFLDKLVPYPEDPTRGYMLGKDRNFTASHRHYSHMLMMYPYHTVNWDNAADRGVMTKTLDNWQSLTGQLQGYSFTGSSAMYASMGQPETALARLTSLVGSGTSPGGYIKPNTLYAETGPVFETPMAAVSSLHELYLQTWGDKLRVFPAVPSAWAQLPLSFISLRTEGAFLISASRSNGKTVFIQVESEAGGLCRLQTGMDLANVKIINMQGQDLDYIIADTTTGLVEISTTAGDIFQVHATDAAIALPSILEHPAAERNAYGSGSPGVAPAQQLETYTIAIRTPQGATIEYPSDYSVPVAVEEGDLFRIMFSVDSGYENPVLLLNGEAVTLAAPLAGIYTYRLNVTSDVVVQLRAEKIILQTKVESTSNSNIKVYATNGYIQVEGTTAIPAAYTLSGTLVDATKRLQAGVYIVKVGGETVKLLIQ